MKLNLRDAREWVLHMQGSVAEMVVNRFCPALVRPDTEVNSIIYSMSKVILT